MTPSITCLIPAHNESLRLGGVLSAVMGHPLIARTIVIDDGSSDGTGDCARAAGASVLALHPNRGKTAALAAALDLVRTSHVLLLDADLIGLTAQDVTRLIAPVADARADVSLSLRGNAPWLWQRLGVDYITGERVLPMSILGPNIGALTRLPRFGFEVYLNDLIRAAGFTVAIIRLPRVTSPSKAHKRGVVAGVWADLAMMADIFRTVSVATTFRQIRFLRKGVPSSRRRLSPQHQQKPGH